MKFHMQISRDFRLGNDIVDNTIDVIVDGSISNGDVDIDRVFVPGIDIDITKLLNYDIIGDIEAQMWELYENECESARFEFMQENEVYNG